MNRKNVSVLKKTIKITGIACVALGGAALIATGAALKALTEGAKYLKNTVQKIIDEPAEVETVIDAEAAEEDFVEETAVAEEPAAAEEPCDLA